MKELIILAFALLSCVHSICPDRNYGKQHSFKITVIIFIPIPGPLIPFCDSAGHQPHPIVDEYINSTIESDYELFDNALSTNISVSFI